MPVIYLTGAPATGKSTLSRNLKREFPDLIVFAYSEKLRELLAQKANSTRLDEDDIRTKSSAIVTPQDVEELDGRLIKLVADCRAKASIVIDSHPVTKERYGFRVTGFSARQLEALNPDVIICLYASAETIVSRIGDNPMGRPQVSRFEADLHTNTQIGVATQYGIHLGKPVYLLDSSVPEYELMTIAAEKARLITR